MNGITLLIPIVDNRIGLSLIFEPNSFRFTDELITKGACGVTVLEIFKEKTGNYPLLILDDLFSELDVEKIEHILELLKPDVQTFITTTELNTLDFLKKFSYKELEINNGQVVKESNHGK